jgi:hypothetical protein
MIVGQAPFGEETGPITPAKWLGVLNDGESMETLRKRAREVDDQLVAGGVIESPVHSSGNQACTHAERPGVNDHYAGTGAPGCVMSASNGGAELPGDMDGTYQAEMVVGLGQGIDCGWSGRRIGATSQEGPKFVWGAGKGLFA